MAQGLYCSLCDKTFYGNEKQHITYEAASDFGTLDDVKLGDGSTRAVTVDQDTGNIYSRGPDGKVLECSDLRGLEKILELRPCDYFIFFLWNDAYFKGHYIRPYSVCLMRCDKQNSPLQDGYDIFGKFDPHEGFLIDS